MKNCSNCQSVSEDAHNALIDYCKSMNYHCITCRYGIKSINPNAGKHVECIFANCPCSWERK